MEKLMRQINEQMEAFTTNAAAFTEKGNQAAGTRARKASLELTKLFKEFRAESIAASKK